MDKLIKKVSKDISKAKKDTNVLLKADHIQDQKIDQAKKIIKKKGK